MYFRINAVKQLCHFRCFYICIYIYAIQKMYNTKTVNISKEFPEKEIKTKV